ncbi:integrative conjugative element protein, RAQPRD family [Lelliottia amnigena]|uniref:integrative conjugative element protein, RAQPRD family n=1 Tax=Lelliottia amnigena TaxID=61646 RepID=UPI0040560172
MSLLLRGIAVFALACLSPMAMASEAELTALMRQLESMECQAEHDADSADIRPVSDRYHFDYARLREDLHHIREGIHDFLTPDRAQPRVPVALHGDYRQELAEQEAP